MPADFTGANNDEWAGPGNPLGQAQFYVYQLGRRTTLPQAQASGVDFTVMWFYDPSEAEIAAGATSRQRQAEVFNSRTSYIAILGRMYRLRREALAAGNFYERGGFTPF